MSAAPAQLFQALTAVSAQPSRPSLFRRALKAIQDARLRQAERDIGRYIQGHGGRITDALERQVERHFI